MRRINRILARVRDDRGVSLVELLVVMMLSSLVLALAMTMFVNLARITSNASSERASTATATNMMDVVATDIRSATNVADGSVTKYAVIAGTQASLTLITYTDAGPTFSQPYQVRFRVDAGRLVEDRWTPNGTSFPRTDSPTVTRVLGETVKNTTLFRYFSATGAALEAPATGLVPAASLALVASIEVTLEVQAPGSGKKVVLINNVGMPNMAVPRT